MKETALPQRDRLFDLSGRVAVITGAAGWLGCALASGMARAGAHVHLVGRRGDSLDRVRHAIESDGGVASSEVLDLRMLTSIPAFAARLSERFGRLHIVVNNAYSGPAATLEDSSPEQYQDAYLVTVAAAAELVRRLLPSLERGAREDGDASVVNVASMYGMTSPDPRIYGESGMNNPPFYGAAKAALIQYTRYAACHLAPRGIRVNAVSPGPFPPVSVRQSSPDLYRRLVDKVPLGRVGEPDDLVGPVLFLASPAARFVTGANLPVDGGWTSW